MSRKIKPAEDAPVSEADLASLASGAPGEREDDWATAAATSATAPVPAWAPPAAPRPRPFKWLRQSRLYKVGSMAVLVAVLLVVGYLKISQSQARRARLAEGIDRNLRELSREAERPPAPPVVAPTATPAPTPQGTPAAVANKPPPPLSFVEEAGRRVGTASASVRSRQTQVRLVLPPGTHGDKSLPCVFVCPAGSNLLTGVPFGEGEQEDFYPLLDLGMAVCFYTLDGTIEDFNTASDTEGMVAMMFYRRANAGLHNLSDAVDTVLAGAPAVDPARLATCGHSSAGTIAVMAAAREPRVRAAAAMAPALDLPIRLAEVIRSADSDFQEFIRSASPSELASLPAPVWVYHARDDTNVPVAEAQAFAAKHPGKVTLHLADQGGHGGALTDGKGLAFRFLATTLRAKAVRAAASAAVPSPASRPFGRASGRTPQPHLRRPVRRAAGVVRDDSDGGGERAGMIFDAVVAGRYAWVMSTVQLDDRLFQEVEDLAARSSRTVQAVVEEAVRTALARTPPRTSTRPNHLPTYGGSGLQPGVDINDSAGLLDIMESPDDPA